LVASPKNRERIARSHGEILRIDASRDAGMADSMKTDEPLSVADQKKRAITDPEKALHLLVEQVRDYAIFLLTPDGDVATWSPAAERIKFYKREDIIGKNFRIFYPPKEQAAKKPEYELRVAAEVGRFEDEGWRIRKDGSRFWANVVITAIRDAQGNLLGYGKVTRDLTERKQSEEQLRVLSGRLLKIQDDERGRLGRELHDTVGQYLAAVKMSLDGLVYEEKWNEEQARKQLADSQRIVERAIREVRTLSYLLYPPMLEDTGLGPAMRWYLDGFSKRSGIQTTIEADNDVRLTRDAELALFRVFQESLTNVHRHSQSKSAHIRFAIENGNAILEVADRGKGMPAYVPPMNETSLGTMGVGIRGMHERLRELNGRLEIDSTSQGTTVRAMIPVVQPSAEKETTTG
jgi:PAS domain S-box-containing protein